MKVLVTCPNRQFVVGKESSRGMMEALKRLGFAFDYREIAGGKLAYAREPVWIELATAEQVFELQDRIGLPLRIEDGVIQIDS